MVRAYAEWHNLSLVRSESINHAELEGIRRSELLVIVARVEATDSVQLMLSGRMTANGIGELRRQVEDGRRNRKRVVLDFSEVTLLDRVSAEYLRTLASPYVQFANCPAYLQPWINGERD